MFHAQNSYLYRRLFFSLPNLFTECLSYLVCDFFFQYTSISLLRIIAPHFSIYHSAWLPIYWWQQAPFYLLKASIEKISLFIWALLDFTNSKNKYHHLYMYFLLLPCASFGTKRREKKSFSSPNQ